jgi:DNA-binding XRE family transcriptional regulator
MIYYQLRPDGRARIEATGLHQDEIAQREGIARFRLDLKEKGQLTKGPQAWKFARAYASVVNISEEAAMELLFIPRPDVKTGGKGQRRQTREEKTRMPTEIG